VEYLTTRIIPNMHMKVNLDRTYIRNFLTLRYNPLQNTTRSLANTKTFSIGNSDPDGKLLEKLLLELLLVI